MNENTERGHEHLAAGQNADVPPLASPGTQLAARRSELNITVEQVASQLNLAPRQIHAIEQDNYAALPGMATARGFIRAYAKLLKIDPAPLLAQIAAETTPAEAGIPLRRALPAQPFFDGRLTGMHKRRSSHLVIALVAVALVLAALAVADRTGLIAIMPSAVSNHLDSGISALSRSVDAASAPKAAGTASSELPNISSAPTAGGVVSGAPELSTPGMTTAPLETAKPDAKPSASPVSGEATAPMAEAPAAVAKTESKEAVPGAASHVARTGGDPLTLTLNEDSWIQLKQPNGSVVMSRVFKAGSSETIPVTGPVVLTIGNAKGVKASFRGAPLDLPKETKSNVARLDLK